MIERPLVSEAREVTTGLYGALKRALDRPGADRGVVLLSLVLMTFCLDTGIAADDFIHKLIATGSNAIPGFAREPLDMFRFTSGEHTMQLARDGVVSWWVDPEAKLAFFRPVSSLSHYIDYNLWPSSPWLMHLHSLLWAGLLLWGLLVFYRRLVTPSWVCALTLFIYALEDGRAWFGSWIAARNAVIATALSVWVLVLHDRGRRDGVVWARWSAPALLLLAVLAGEGAVAICAYLFAHALFLDRGSLRERIMSLIPYALVVITWRVGYVLAGYGAANSGLYFDPVGNPEGFLRALSERAPILLFSQLGGSWSDGWSALFAFPNLHRTLVAMSTLVCLAVGYALWPLLRRDPTVRFGVTGALLALLPASAAFSADRLLSWVAIGAAVAIARLIATYIQDREQLSVAPVRALILPPLVLFLVVTNVVIDPIFLPSRARGNMAMRDVLDRAHEAVPDTPDIRDRQIVYINPAAVPLSAYIPIERAASGVPFARDQVWLATAETEVRVTREDERTLRVRPRGGFLLSLTSHLLRDPSKPFTQREVELRGLRIEVVELTDDGRPAEILARFERPLSDPKFLWLQWDEIGFAPFVPPEVGQSVTLPPADYLRVVFGDALPLPFDGRLPAPRDPHWARQ